MRSNKTLFAAMFLAAAGLILLEVTATRVIGYAVGSGDVGITIALAILGVGAAGSLLSRRRTSAVEESPASAVDADVVATRAKLLAAWFMGFAAASTVTLFLLARLLKSLANHHHDQKASFASFISITRHDETLALIVLGCAMAVCYGFYGACIAILFRDCSRGVVGRLYASDLVGGSLGALVAVGLLEVNGFRLPFAAAVAIPILAAACLCVSAGYARAAVVVGGASLLLLGALSIPGAERAFEPPGHAASEARTLQRGEYHHLKSKELFHTWTSYGRIAALELSLKSGLKEQIMVHGRGEGHARVPPYPMNDTVDFGSKIATAACKPGRALVLLAGAGYDMAGIDRDLLTTSPDGGASAEIVGVELVPQVFGWPSRDPTSPLGSFLQKPGRRIVAAEAREFLARDPTRYECILISWNGHTLSYYTGASAASTEHLYSKEAMTTLIDHLAPGGQLTVLNGNKVRVMLTLREILQERGVVDAAADFVVVGRDGDLKKWEDSENRVTLLFKKDGFSKDDVDETERRLIGKRNVIYAPGRATRAGGAPFEAAATSADPLATVAKLLPKKQHMLLTPTTDDWPYFSSVIPRDAFWHRWFWKSAPHERPMMRRQKAGWQRRVVIAPILLGISAILVVAPVTSVRRRRRFWAPAVLRHVAYFAGIGAGFMWIEVGVIQKLRMIVGHPGIALGLTLSSVMLFAGVGSFVSSRHNISARHIALAGALLALAYAAVVGPLVPMIMALPRVAALVIAFLLPGPLAFLLGHLLPRGVAAVQTREGRLVPWVLAINATAGTVATALASPISYALGFNSLLILGAVAYLLVAAFRVDDHDVTNSTPLTGR